VSIDQYVTGAGNYWDLYVNGKPSPIGMDLYLVQPIDAIEPKWITVPATTSGGGSERRQSRKASG
jgi:hypothetical protein